MANPQNVELEAAKFLHKLIQESTDEPTKLATKLYVILQHMRSSGKENSMPYQVISRAMETVIKQHALDIEALMSSRLPLAAGPQVGESGSSQVAGSSQRIGLSKDPKAGLTASEMSKPDSYASGMSLVGPTGMEHDVYQGSPSNMTGGAGKVCGPSAASSYQLAEAGMAMPMQFASSPYDNQGFAAKVHKDETFSAAPPSMDLYAGKNIAGKLLEHEGGANIFPTANKLNQGAILSNAPETSMLRSVAVRDTGKSPVAQAPISGLPFKEHHLKQLRAQCLVFLAFRNGLMPKKLHLEIALGNFFPKEEGARREMIDHKGKELSINEPNSIPEGSRASGVLDKTRGMPSTGTHLEGDFSKEADNSMNMKEDKSGYHAVPSEQGEDKRHHLTLRRKPEAEMPKQEASESQSSSLRGIQEISNSRIMPVSRHEDGSGNNRQLQRKQNFVGQSQFAGESNGLGHQHTDSTLPSLPSRDQWKPISGTDSQNNMIVPVKDSDVVPRNVLPAPETDTEEEDASATADRPPSPKYTTSEKWILDRQKRKLLNEKMWALKQQKTEQKKIAVCSAKLKENVSSSEDIFAKTKSVIELKKLQLLELQRRLRSDILNDFFKPIAPEMDRLKSIKKHRIGRRSKQLERYEQKMKEERQKRIRERQKEFFSEVEVHRERLEDVFKMKRERWKGFNRSVREFHKRKERIHREKIDRIQREKINLLKINDVEGYLRMVQDAKSDRVKQLLKETEKYLQKLGSKLQEAKTVARRFETDIDENRTAFMEKNDFAIENEDEADQAKHYLESNEKYYMMAHSVKETVLEQPTMLVGGKLREYQMNGLRWLVSLYNNHLNGILADEMGLGKTVQVISLMCYLMETKNDRGPFLVVVPSSVLPGWESEINFWAPGIHKIVYSGPPEERRRLFKERIVHLKFNVLLTTYEYLMNKHDRPKLSKIQWHYVIIDEGHRIKNASCKLNADLKQYKSNHRLLLTGTPLQNNLEELWALLNFLLPNIFNSSEDFSQWFNKPFESNGDNSPDEALLSEEENLLIINRLHQVLRPFVLRRLKHKVENQLPEKIERLVRCEASAYQKLLMKRVEENLGAFGTSKARSVHNSVMELRNICNHPYLSQLHVEEVHDLIPKHYLPNIVRLCGKLEMLDRLLPKLKATDHRVLLFSTMTRLLDVMEDYLCWKQYKYLRLDGHTSGGDRGALIEQFNQPGSPFFIFLLSIRAGGVGVNLQAADTVIIFDTDWNPQVDLQAQARAHRIGQKREVLVLRLETVQTVEEQVRASAEHKLGVANQSITAGFFDNNTSAEDRREYLEALLRECKKEEAAPVLDDDALNDLLARSESEIDIFESVDHKRREEEMGVWRKLVTENGTGDSECSSTLPSRLLTDDELKPFYEAMKISEAAQQGVASNSGMKRKSEYVGSLDTQQYGRGKRAREVRSYEEQLTEEEFEKMCKADSPGSPQVKEEITEKKLSTIMSDSLMFTAETQKQMPQQPLNLTVEPAAVHSKEITPPSKRGRGRPRKIPTAKELVPSPGVLPSPSAAKQMNAVPKVETISFSQMVPTPECLHGSTPEKSITTTVQQIGIGTDPGALSVSLPSVAHAVQPTTIPFPSTTVQGRGRGRKAQSGGEAPRRRGKRLSTIVIPSPLTPKPELGTQVEGASSSLKACNPDPALQSSDSVENSEKPTPVSHVPLLSSTPAAKLDLGSQEVPVTSSTMPASDAFPGSLVMAGPNSSSIPIPDAVPSTLFTSGVAQKDPLARTVASANPVPAPPFPSCISGSPSTAPAHPAPTRGRGRGRKPQSGGEPPRRRGKRQNPLAPVTSEVSIDHDPRSAEPPEKKSRASVGRRPTTRNMQENDGLKQANVFDSVASQSITNPATVKVLDSTAENESQKPTNMIQSDASKSFLDSVAAPVIEDVQDNEVLKPINIVQAGASQGIVEPSVIQVSKDHKENETDNQTNNILSNASQSPKCLPVDQALSVPPPLQESKTERDYEGRKPYDVQLDPSPGIVESSVTNITKNQQQSEAKKQTNIILSDPPESGVLDESLDQASEMEKRTHKPACDVECDAPQCITDPSREQRQDNETGEQTDTDQVNACQSVVAPPTVQVDKCVPQNDAQIVNNVMESDSARNVAHPSVAELQDVYQGNEAQQDTDIQSDTATVLSGPMVDHGECIIECREEVGDAIGKVENSLVDLHETLSSSCTPVSGILLDGSDNQAKNEEQVKKDSFPEPGCLEKSTAEVTDIALNKSSDFSTEQDTQNKDRDEAGVNNILALKPEMSANMLSHSTSAIVESTTMESSSSMFAAESRYGEEHVKRKFLDESLVSDPGLTDVSKKGADNLVLSKHESCEGKICTSLSDHAALPQNGETDVSENLNGKLGAGDEQKGSVFDRSQTSLFLNDGTAIPNSEVLEEISKVHCDETVAEEHVLSQDSISVLSSFENVVSDPSHPPNESEDLCREENANNPESKATGLGEVSGLKHELTGVGDVGLKDSVVDRPQTSGLLNEAITALDSEVSVKISDIHGNKAVTEVHEKQDPDQGTISDVFSIKDTASVIERASDKLEDPCEKGDGNDPESKKATGLGEILVLKHESTVIQETSSPTLSASKEEAPDLDTAVKETRNQGIEEDANQQEGKNLFAVESLDPKPEVSEVEVHAGKADAEEVGSRGCFVENAHAIGLTHATITELRKDVEEKGFSQLQIIDTQITYDGATKEKSVCQSSEGSAPEVLEKRNLEVDLDAGATFEGLISLEERLISNIETHRDRPSATEGKSENVVDSEIIEENPCKNSITEAAESTVQMNNLKGALPEMAKGDSDSGTDDSGKHQSRDGILESFSTFEVTGAQSLETVLVLEAQNKHSANDGQSEREADLQPVEENSMMDIINTEVTASTMQTLNLKDGLAEMAVGDNGSRRDDTEILATRDCNLEKDSVSTAEVTGVQNLGEMTTSTISVLEMEGLVFHPPEKETDRQSDSKSELVEDGNALNPNGSSVAAAEICEIETKSAANLLENMVDSPSIEEQASLSLEITSQGATPDKVSTEKSETESAIDFVAEVQGSKNSELDTTVDADAEASELQPCASVGGSESKDDGSANLMGNMVDSRQSIEKDASLSYEISGQEVKYAEALAEKSEIGFRRDFVLDVQGSKSAELDKLVVADAEASEPQPRTNVEASGSIDVSADLLENMVDSRQSVEEEASLSSEVPSQDVTPAEVFMEKSDIGSGRDLLADIQESKSYELDKTVVVDAEASEPQSFTSVGASESKDGSVNFLEVMVDSRHSIEEEASLFSEIASQDVTPAEAFAERSETGSGRDIVADVQGSKCAEVDKIVVGNAEASEPHPCTDVGASESKAVSTDLLENMVDSRQSIEKEESLASEIASQDVAPAEFFEKKSQIGSGRDNVADLQGSICVELDKIVVENAEANESQPCADVGASESKAVSADLLENMVDSGQSIEKEASLASEIAGQDVAAAEVLSEKSEIGLDRDLVADVQANRSTELDKSVVADAEASEHQPCVNVGASESKDGLQQLVEEYSDMAADM